MDTMTLISQRPPSSNEVKRTLEKEHQANLSTISELRFELNRMKNETLELAAKHNEELSSYESQFAKLRSEIEKGEAMRQSLEYELAVARKQCSMEKMSLEEEKINSLRLQEQFKAQIEDLHKKMNSVEFVFQTAQHTWVESKKTFENGIQSRDTIIQNFKREQQVTELEKSKLKSWLETQTSKVEELTKKLNEMETERNSFMDNLKHQKRELDYCLEREERLKAELEAVTLKAKKLDENIEAERAAHLESKFNSEIIQLRIRDLEGTLEVEKASHSQAATELDMIKNQFKELERVYSIERNKAEDTAEKLKKSEEDFSISMIQLKLELDEKKQIVTDLSSNLKNKEEICVKLEHELALLNDRHSCVEESYDNAMRELQSLADSFTVSSQRTSGISKDKVKPAGFAVVLETLRHTLTDYQSRLEGASNELEEANNLYMKTKEELQASKQILQTLCSNLEKTQSDLLGAKQELNHLYAHKESQISHFQMDLEKAQYGWEKEKLKVMEAENEIQKLTRAYQKDTEEKLTFLYSLYQRLVAGCVIIKQPENMLGKFSWPELCAVLQENVDVLIADLNRANEKVSHLEYVCKNRADVMREMQQSHEDSLNELAAQMKEQETCWQKQNRDLEQRYSVLLGEVQARAQKFQRVAEKYKEKIAVFEKTNDQMALQNVNVKNMLVNNEKDLKSLLTACALMTGALYPLYSRSCTLTTQKDILQHQVNTYVEAQREMMTLMQALSEPEERRHTKKNIVTKRNIKSKIHLFRKSVVAILAVNRLQLLGRSSSCLFTWLDPKKKGNGIIVCGGVAKKKTFVTGQDGELVCYEEARRWFSSPELLTSVVVSVSELLGVLTTKDLNSQTYGHLINAAKNSFTKLMNKLQIEMEKTTAANDRCANCFESESLVQRLAHGLQRINSQTSHKAVTSTTSIIKCVTTLKKQIFDFTQRLHTTEVERRSLRLELSDLKQKMNELQKNTNNAETCNEHSKQSKCVPYEKFLCACEELNNALLREQQAQTLLNEQAQQLMELNNRIEVHSTDEREKDQMLSEAVKGLSEAKLELRRKDQSLRQLNRQLTQLEQDKRRIEESIQEAEIALHKAANDKDTLISHMKSVDVVLQKVRDHISLSWAAAIRNDFTLQLPKLHPSIFAVEGSPGGPGFTVCQNMIKMFIDIYQLTYSRTTALEKELASHQKHIEALKCELQTACLRETKSMFPINYPLTKKTETSLDKTNLSEFLPLEAELDKSQSIMKATFGSIQSHSINSL